MEKVTKSVFCKLLDKDVKASFFLSEGFGNNGSARRKLIDYYECSNIEECNIDLVTDCSCFKEVKRVESELNVR